MFIGFIFFLIFGGLFCLFPSYYFYLILFEKHLHIKHVHFSQAKALKQDIFKDI